MDYLLPDPYLGFHFYVNPGGWLDITVYTERDHDGSDDSSYTPSESSASSDTNEVVSGSEKGYLPMNSSKYAD